MPMIPRAVRASTALLLAAAAGSAQASDGFAEAKALTDAYCVACHAGTKGAGGFSLDGFDSAAALAEAPHDWQSVRARVRDGAMPPRGMPAPEPEARQAFANWIDRTLRDAACAQGLRPGPSPLRRLNRDEYSATIRDLFFVHFNAGASLPADGAGGEGFDNAAETLFLSPVHAEKYLDAAKATLDYARADPKARERFLTAEPGPDKTPQQAAREILENFLPRAFRRPVAESELQTFLSLFERAHKKDRAFESSILYALEAALISPHFLFRVEAPGKGPEPEPVSDFELATRLSYFLWGTMPDAELLRLADKGILSKPEILNGKVECMLTDRRTQTFSERFVEQWLGTRELGRDIEPDAEKFPEYQDSVLQAAIRYEPILFFDEVLSNDLSLLNLLDSEFSVLNKTLVKHYGMAEVEGLRQNPKVVPLAADGKRGGLLAMAAVLATSSYPHRTSPVLRGKWILETILGEPPPPPPPDVPELEETHADQTPRTLRARLEQHRANPTCASCHDRIDPLGFGLENYDVLGRWRTEDEGGPIDATGVLPDGTEFHNPEELKAILFERKDQFLRVVTEKMLAYALGRGLTFEDRCTVDQIVDRVKETGYNSHTIVLEIVNSAPFRMKPGRAQATDD